MRADRLVAILLILQTRGQVTATEVATELEVSERTARRDLEALGMAGIPVYSQQGRNGGWRLAGGGRTDLSGLTVDEARALFLVAGPSSSVTPQVKAALRKLLRALPEPLRQGAEAASSAVVVDATDWGRTRGGRPAPPHLDAVQRAVIEGEQLLLGYVARDRAATTRVVHPLGLASKSSSWYLVAGTAAGLRSFRLDRVTSVERTGQGVLRPAGFDLAETWRGFTTAIEEGRSTVWASALAAPGIVPHLRYLLGTRVRIGPSSEDGRVEVQLGGGDLHTLAAQIAGFGNDLELLDPPEARHELARIGAELVAAYGPA